MMYTEETINGLMKGAYDLHIHAAPSPLPRAFDDYELLKQADEADMAGIMLKSHYDPTAVRARLVNAHSPYKAKAYGGLVLNWPAGGLNPYAVANALVRGAKMIWMPTRDAANILSYGPVGGSIFTCPGLTILDDHEGIKPEVYEILELVKKHNAALATGHLSPKESLLLCEAGRKQGVRMVLTHPEYVLTALDSTLQAHLASLGVIIEHCWYNLAAKNCSPAAMAANIRAAGAAQCYLSTDRGQTGCLTPVEAMKKFLATLLEAGISEQELAVMVKEVPERVLGLA